MGMSVIVMSDLVISEGWKEILYGQVEGVWWEVCVWNNHRGIMLYRITYYHHMIQFTYWYIVICLAAIISYKDMWARNVLMICEKTGVLGSGSALTPTPKESEHCFICKDRFFSGHNSVYFLLTVRTRKSLPVMLRSW